MIALHGAGRTADEADDIVGSAALRTAARRTRPRSKVNLTTRIDSHRVNLYQKATVT